MKIQRDSYEHEGSSVNRGPCLSEIIEHINFEMNYSKSKGLFQTPRTMPDSCLTRQFHSQALPLDLTPKLNPIAILSYADVAKIRPSVGLVGRIPGSQNGGMPIPVSGIIIHGPQPLSSGTPQQTMPSKPLQNPQPIQNGSTPQATVPAIETKKKMPYLNGHTLIKPSRASTDKDLLLNKQLPQNRPSSLWCSWRNCGGKQLIPNPHASNISFEHFKPFKTPESKPVVTAHTLMVVNPASKPSSTPSVAIAAASSWRSKNAEPNSTKNFSENNLRTKRKSNNTKFWQRTPNILQTSWRSVSPISADSNKSVIHLSSREVSLSPSKSNFTKESTPPAIAETIQYTETDSYGSRLRQPSESSQASEDSFIVFEKQTTSDSEISSLSSDEYDESDTETSSHDSTTSQETEEFVTTDGESDPEEEELTLQLGDNTRLSLPSLTPLPPLRSSLIKPSLSEDSEDDDDFIVFDDNYISCDEDSDASEETEVDGKTTRTNIKVRFADQLEEVCYLYDDDDARDARCGEWEEFARDRARFRARVVLATQVISPILSPEHRQQVWEKRTQLNNSNETNSKI